MAIIGKIDQKNVRKREEGREAESKAIYEERTSGWDGGVLVLEEVRQPFLLPALPFSENTWRPARACTFWQKPISYCSLFMAQKYINDLERFVATNSREGKGSEIYLTRGKRGGAGTRTDQDSWGINQQTCGVAKKQCT